MEVGRRGWACSGGKGGQGTLYEITKNVNKNVL